MPEEAAPSETPTQRISFKDYEPALLEKEDIEKIIVLLYGKNTQELPVDELSKLLVEDKLVVRQKYGLPKKEIWIQQPVDYYHQLEEIASREKIPVKNKEEYGRFFQDRFASAVHLGSEGGLIAMNKIKDTDSVSTVAQKAATFEHELIHGVQFKRYPNMSLVRKEYEAYLAHANNEVLNHKPWLFFERIGMSITPDQLRELWQEHENKSKVKEVVS